MSQILYLEFIGIIKSLFGFDAVLPTCSGIILLQFDIPLGVLYIQEGM